MSSTTERGTGAASEASLAELIKQLSEQSSRLARQEVELAKAELAVKGKRAGIGAGMFGGAGCLRVLRPRRADRGRGPRAGHGGGGLAGRPDRRGGARRDRRRAGPAGQEQGAAGDPAGARRGGREREGGRAMGEDPGTAGTPVRALRSKDPEQIREEIEATRRELGDTVEALAAKADVKAPDARQGRSTKESAAQTKDVAGKAREASPDSVTAGASRRRRRPSRIRSRSRRSALSSGASCWAG